MDNQTSKRINDLGDFLGTLADVTYQLMDTLFWLQVNDDGIRKKYQKMFLLLLPYHKYHEDLKNGVSRVQALVSFTISSWNEREDLVTFSKIITGDALRHTETKETFKKKCKNLFYNFLGFEYLNFYENIKREIQTHFGDYYNKVIKMESKWSDTELIMRDYPKEMLLVLLKPANKLERFAYEEILNQCILRIKGIVTSYKLHSNPNKKKILKTLDFEMLHLDDFGKQYDFKKYYPIYQSLMKVYSECDDIFPIFQEGEKKPTPKDKEGIKQLFLDVEKACLGKENESAPALPDKMDEILIPGKVLFASIKE